MDNCDWRTTRLPEPTADGMKGALASLLASHEWNRPLSPDERDFLESQIE